MLKFRFDAFFALLITSFIVGIKNGKHHTDKRFQQNPDLFDDEVVQDYLGRNFAELMIEGYEKLLNEWSKIATDSQIKN